MKKSKKRQPRAGTLMYRSATELQKRYRKAVKALRVAKGIIEYVRPEVYERDDWLDEQKKLFAEHCDDFGIK